MFDIVVGLKFPTTTGQILGSSWHYLRILSFFNLNQLHIFPRKFDLLQVDRERMFLEEL